MPGAATSFLRLFDTRISGGGGVLTKTQRRAFVNTRTTKDRIVARKRTAHPEAGKALRKLDFVRGPSPSKI